MANMQSCKLICIPYAGLCNRISCLMSALYLADNYSRFDVNVYWNNSNECKGYFDQLFEPLERVNFKILRLNSRNILYNRHIPSKLKKSISMKYIKEVLMILSSKKIFMEKNIRFIC